jgi:hypothetical protein
MKIDIYFESKIYSTEINQPIQIKDIISNFQKLINIPTSKLIILNNKKELLENSETINIQKEKKTFYIIDKSKINLNQITDFNIIEKEEPIEKIITKATNAKIQLEKKKTEIRNNRLDFNQELQNGGNLGRLLAMLQTLEERNLINIQIINQNNNNIEPNENHVNSLKEMGFPEDRIRSALIRARNNINRATDILISEMDEI